MADITLSSAVRSNLLNLQSTADLLGKTQERLATGLKVNSALDNPTNFFTANALESRASDLGRLLDSISSATQTLEAADNGLTGLTKLVESAQATARQALQTAATVDETTTAVTAEAAALGDVAIADDVAATATGTVDLGAATATDLASTIATDEDTFTITVDGDVLTVGINNSNAGGTFAGTADVTVSLDFATATVDDLIAALDTQISSAGAQAVNAAFADFEVALDGDNSLAITSAATDVDFSTADTSGTFLTVGVGIADADYEVSNDTIGALSGTLTIGYGEDTETITFGAGEVETRAGLETALATAAANLGITAEIDGDDFLSFVAADDAETSIEIGGTIDVDAAFGIEETEFEATTEDTTAAIANPERDEYVTQYNDLLGQIDALVGDSSFNGVNLLNGDTLSVLFNEDGTSSLEITGVTYDSDGLGLTEVADGGFDENDDINDTLDTLGDAVDDLRAQASNFGSNLSVVEIRQNFTKNMINTLETGAGNLTLADSNEEAANLLALQTRQQLSSTALSLASQADQNVLRLF